MALLEAELVLHPPDPPLVNSDLLNSAQVDCRALNRTRVRDIWIRCLKYRKIIFISAHLIKFKRFILSLFVVYTEELSSCKVIFLALDIHGLTTKSILLLY